MRFCLISIFFSLFLNQGFTQATTRYYDIQGMEIDSALSYYSVTYFDDKNLRPISKYSRTKALVYKERGLGKDLYKRTYFYETGQLKAIGIFYVDVLVGTTQVFYRNGKPQSVVLFGKTDNQVRIVSNWDSLGNSLLNEGNGVCQCNLNPFDVLEIIQSGTVIDSLQHGEWKGQTKGGQFHFVEIYDKGNLKSGVTYAGKDIHNYRIVEETAEPNGGLPTFYRYISRSMKYPAAARRIGVEGEVFVQFIVERDGSFSNIIVIKGIGSGCDEEVIRVLRRAPKWKPGTVRGRPVKQLYSLPPIIFKLG